MRRSARDVQVHSHKLHDKSWYIGLDALYLGLSASCKDGNRRNEGTVETHSLTDDPERVRKLGYV